jgi:hypothetical protein
MTIGSHQRGVAKSQTYITPKPILKALGEFDLDPCAAPVQPWRTAKVQWALPEHNGLERNWLGRVWLNPPFDSRGVLKWVDKMGDHKRGTLLIHARTETKWFQRIWATADALLFLYNRVYFARPDGSTLQDNSGAPVVLCAYGQQDMTALKRCGLPGAYMDHWAP